MTAFPHLRAALMSAPWAIEQGRLEAIVEVVERRIDGTRLSAEEIALIKGERQPNGVVSLFGLNARTGAVEARQERSSPAAGSAVAVINVMGIIAQHASQVDDISGPGGTSTERVSQSLNKALADPSVGSIVLNFDSPGGSVSGVQALANEIYRARGRKPIVAQVNSLAASAAYWIASSADEIVMTPGALAGSIGVYALHADVSKAADKAGFKFTYISAGKFKVEGNQFEPLGDDAFAAQKKIIDAYYSDFTSGVARGRGVAVDRVRSGFGEGRVVKDNEAVKQGMADRVATLDATLQQLIAGKKPSAAPGKSASRHSVGIAADADMRARRHRLRLKAKA
ncbi:MAG: S49 family peptidase [Mesorhizobium sp.]|nr:MAG: S49 family peptidase [Mesorhizobium sp.]